MQTTLIDREASEAWRRQVELAALDLVVAQAIAKHLGAYLAGYNCITKEPEPGATVTAWTLYPSLLRRFTAAAVLAAARGAVRFVTAIVASEIAWNVSEIDFDEQSTNVKCDDAAEMLTHFLYKQHQLDVLLSVYADELSTINQQTATMVAEHEAQP